MLQAGTIRYTTQIECGDICVSNRDVYGNLRYNRKLEIQIQEIVIAAL